MNVLSSVTLAGLASVILTTVLPQDKQAKKDEPVQLGNFSISLTVKDIKASKEFYEKLDFKQVGGKLEQNWVVLQNGTTKIGCSRDVREEQLDLQSRLGRDEGDAEGLPGRARVQRTLKARGLKLKLEADEKTDGPAFFTLEDPDGNPILVDQHVPKPKR
jgi:Lactoylglutathione lyase and related lyases